MFSVKRIDAVCELNTEMNLPLPVSNQYTAIGDESRPWHILANLLETKEAKFVIGIKTNRRYSYYVRFFDARGNLVLRANFVKKYDTWNIPIQERLVA